MTINWPSWQDLLLGVGVPVGAMTLVIIWDHQRWWWLGRQIARLRADINALRKRMP